MSTVPSGSPAAASSAAAAPAPSAGTPHAKPGAAVTHLDWVAAGIPKRTNKVALITGITGQGQ